MCSIDFKLVIIIQVDKLFITTNRLDLSITTLHKRNVYLNRFVCHL